MANKNTKKTNGVWIATLDRFGYDLTVAGQTEEEATNALLDEYKKEYKKINGSSPSRDYLYGDRNGQTYLESAKDDIEIQFCEFGKVEWR